MVNVVFEGSTSVQAVVYLFKTEYMDLLDKQEWDVSWFENEGIELFFKAYQGFQGN